MYVRVLSFTCRVDAEKQQIQNVYRLVIDEVRHIDGFIGSTLLMRENACSGMAMIYWRHEDAATEAGPGIISVLSEHAHQLLDHAPDIEGYHVIENGIIPGESHESGDASPGE